MNITPTTKPIGLIGYPLSHSLSPKLHNAIYQKYGIDCVYLAFNTEKERLEDVINGFKSLSFVGFNVTVPYKQSVLPFLDDLDKEAAIIGAVNTVKIENGKLIGYNTDGWGFIGSLKNKGYNIGGMDVLVLGAGGSARAICVYLAKEGANTINILNRTESNAMALGAHIMKNYPHTTVKIINNNNLDHIKADIIINTTSVGMWPNVDESPLKGYSFLPKQLVVDIIYNPLQTKLLKDAKEDGCDTVNGLDMLVGQAVKAIEIFTGVAVDYGYGLMVLSQK